MPADTDPYVPANPGDLITAEMWNSMQLKIKADIVTTVDQEIEEITDVDHAGDASKLDGKTPRELADEIVERALRELAQKSGYRRIHTVLKAGDFHKIEHKLGLAPLVDIYRLEYFPVVYREDDQTYLSWATFYLRHSSESRIRFSPPAPAKAVSVELEGSSGPAFKLKFSDLLERYRVEFDDDSSLDDLETEFWQAFLASPNEGFDDNQYGHSPWFERCCKEKTTVKQLKRAGDWDELWLQMMPVKQAVFLPFFGNVFGAAGPQGEGAPDPVVVDVFHTDFDTTAFVLRPNPTVTYSEEKGWRDRLGLGGAAEGRVSVLPTIAETFPDSEKELKVMILLKV
ncbi:MAG TPA: hypothetical protein VN851_21860 [Thermoanaerobaculia bacterium]|nr:hypothetical protein [Thermoanaerobaculia bacterium]